METQNNESAIGSVQGGVRLILNGGSNIMERATVPIQWFFSPEVIKENPVEILIIEQSEMSHEYGRSDAGDRYYHKVSDCIAFIQLFTPGRHRFAVLVLNDTPCRLKRMQREGQRRYCLDIPFPEIEKAIRRNDYRELGEDVVSATIKEIEVPQELFAPRNRSKIGEAIWAWTNRWSEFPARDECQYRGRLIFAFTLQPILFGIGMFCRLIIQIAASILFPLIRMAVFFFGFKPSHLFKYTRDIWDWDYNPNQAMHTFLSKDVEGYRVWSIKNGKTRYMPITGIEVVSLLAIGWALKFIIDNLSLTGLIMTGSIAVIALITVLVIARISRWNEDLELVATKRRDTYAQWLRNLTLDQAPQRVDLHNLPVAFNGGLAHRFRVGFWNAKMKVCKPYSSK